MGTFPLCVSADSFECLLLTEQKTNTTPPDGADFSLGVSDVNGEGISERILFHDDLAYDCVFTARIVQEKYTDCASYQMRMSFLSLLDQS